MLKDKLDIKFIFIIVLGLCLILSLVFRPSKSIDDYEEAINKLNEQNDSLAISNDNLKLQNYKLEEENKKILIEIDSTQSKLDNTNNRLKDLENGKSKVSGYVNSLDADGIANSLSNYLNGSKK